MTAVAAVPPVLLKIDLGCGPNKAGPDWVGADIREFPGVDKVFDLRERWPWDDDSVDEARSSHFVEHLKPAERVHFVNELYRVLKPGAKAQIICPYWSSERAYGDLTHEWPPVSGMWFYYLKREWRAVNAPHNDRYTCDFDATWGFAVHEDYSGRHAEVVQEALAHRVNAAQDVIATLIKPVAKQP